MLTLLLDKVRRERRRKCVRGADQGLDALKNIETMYCEGALFYT